MIITWYGQSCFRINTQKNRSSSVNILIDSLIKESGLRSPKLEADILLFTNPDNEKMAKGDCFLITGPGEYDVKEVYVEGISTQAKKNTIFTIEAEGMKICHLGKLDQKELSSEQLEKIGVVDILMLPIGGLETLNAEEAMKVMAQIEPKITIPMYYKVPKLKINPVRDSGGKKKAQTKKISNGVKLDTLDKFLKALAIKSLQPLPKLSIKKKELSSEEAKVIVLEP